MGERLNLTEKLKATNRDDFLPFERCVEIISALHDEGLMAYPHSELSHHPEYGDYMQLRVWEKGRVDDGCTRFITFSFENEKLIVFSGSDDISRQYLGSLANCMEQEINDTNCTLKETNGRKELITTFSI